MKKRIILVACALAAVIVMCGCGGRVVEEELTSKSEIQTQSDATVSQAEAETTNNPFYPDSKTTVTLSHWMSGGSTEKTSVNAVLKQLEKDYPNISVKVNFVSGDYSTKMYANLAAKKEPDVFMVADGDFGKWVKAGVLENLSPYVAKSTVFNPDEIWESAVTRYSYDGKTQGKGDLYVIAKDISPRVLFYNKSILKKYNVPEPSKTTPMNYEQFAAFLKKLTNKNDNVWGIAQINWEGWIRSYGTSLLTSDFLHSNLGDAKLQNVFQLMSDLIHVHKVIPPSSQLDSSSALILFQTGQAACYDGAIYNVISIRDYDFEWDVCPLPGGTEDPYATGYTGSVGYGISKNGKHKDAAYLVAEYFGGKTAQRILCEIGFNIPLNKEMANSDVFLKNEKNMSAFVTAAEHQMPLDVVYTDNDQWYTVLGNRIQPLWNDSSSKASALFPTIKSEIDALLG